MNTELPQDCPSLIDSLSAKGIPLQPVGLLKLANLSNFIEANSCYSCSVHENAKGCSNLAESKFNYLSKLISNNLIEINRNSLSAIREYSRHSRNQDETPFSLNDDDIEPDDHSTTMTGQLNCNGKRALNFPENGEVEMIKCAKFNDIHASEEDVSNTSSVKDDSQDEVSDIIVDEIIEIDNIVVSESKIVYSPTVFKFTGHSKSLTSFDSIIVETSDESSEHDDNNNTAVREDLQNFSTENTTFAGLVSELPLQNNGVSTLSNSNSKTLAGTPCFQHRKLQELNLANYTSLTITDTIENGTDTSNELDKDQVTDFVNVCSEEPSLAEMVFNVSRDIQEDLECISISSEDSCIAESALNLIQSFPNNFDSIIISDEEPSSDEDAVSKKSKGDDTDCVFIKFEKPPIFLKNLKTVVEIEENFESGKINNTDRNLNCGRTSVSEEPTLQEWRTLVSSEKHPSSKKRKKDDSGCVFVRFEKPHISPNNDNTVIETEEQIDPGKNKNTAKDMHCARTSVSEESTLQERGTLVSTEELPSSEETIFQNLKEDDADCVFVRFENPHISPNIDNTGIQTEKNIDSRESKSPDKDINSGRTSFSEEPTLQDWGTLVSTENCPSSEDLIFNKPKEDDSDCVFVSEIETEENIDPGENKSTDKEMNCKRSSDSEEPTLQDLETLLSSSEKFVFKKPKKDDSDCVFVRLEIPYILPNNIKTGIETEENIDPEKHKMPDEDLDCRKTTVSEEPTLQESATLVSSEELPSSEKFISQDHALYKIQDLNSQTTPLVPSNLQASLQVHSVVDNNHSNILKNVISLPVDASEIPVLSLNADEVLNLCIQAAHEDLIHPENTIYIGSEIEVSQSSENETEMYPNLTDFSEQKQDPPESLASELQNEPNSMYLTECHTDSFEAEIDNNNIEHSHHSDLHEGLSLPDLCEMNIESENVSSSAGISELQQKQKLTVLESDINEIENEVDPNSKDQSKFYEEQSLSPSDKSEIVNENGPSSVEHSEFHEEQRITSPDLPDVEIEYEKDPSSSDISEFQQNQQLTAIESFINEVEIENDHSKFHEEQSLNPTALSEIVNENENCPSSTDQFESLDKQGLDPPYLSEVEIENETGPSSTDHCEFYEDSRLSPPDLPRITVENDLSSTNNSEFQQKQMVILIETHENGFENENNHNSTDNSELYQEQVQNPPATFENKNRHDNNLSLDQLYDFYQEQLLSHPVSFEIEVETENNSTPFPLTESHQEQTLSHPESFEMEMEAENDPSLIDSSEQRQKLIPPESFECKIENDNDFYTTDNSKLQKDLKLSPPGSEFCFDTDVDFENELPCINFKTDEPDSLEDQSDTNIMSSSKNASGLQISTCEMEKRRLLGFDDIIKDIEEGEEMKKKEHSIVNEIHRCSPESHTRSALYNRLTKICDSMISTRPNTFISPFMDILNSSSAFQFYSPFTIDNLWSEAINHPFTKIEKRLRKLSASEFLSLLKSRLIVDFSEKHFQSSNISSMCLFFWRMLSIHDSKSTVLNCQKTILFLLEKFKTKYFPSICELLKILINMGIQGDYCPFPHQYEKSQKTLTFKENLISQPPKETETLQFKKNLLRNFEVLIETLESAIPLVGVKIITSDKLCELALIIAWLSCDEKIFMSTAKGPLRRCLNAAVVHIPNEEWPEKLHYLTERLASLGNGHECTVHLLDMLQPEKRGMELRRCVSFCALHFLLKQAYDFQEVSLDVILNFLQKHKLNKIEDHHLLHNLILLTECCIGIKIHDDEKQSLQKIVIYLRNLYSLVPEEVFIESHTVVRSLLVRISAKLQLIAEDQFTEKKLMFKSEEDM